MCNQTAGLIARALEESGISTVTISLLQEITAKIKPPRALQVSYGFGFPFGRPDDVTLQRKILKAALRMLDEVTLPGTVWEFEENSDGDKASSN